jgi:Fic family protein
LGTQHRHRWETTFEGMSRADRRGCEYDAFVPDQLAGWNLMLPADLVADLADAEQAVRELNRTGGGVLALEGLARFLLRAESVASSRIEGLEAGARRLLEAEVVLGEGGAGADRVAVEVLGNIAAMDAAVELGAEAPSIRLDGMLDIHRRLMDRSPVPDTVRQSPATVPRR